MDDFKAKFKKKFNTDVQIYAPYVYDAVNVMVAAMVKAGSADPAKYLPVLAKTDGYKGVTGTIAFDDKGDIKNGALTLYTYKGDKQTKSPSCADRDLFPNRAKRPHPRAFFMLLRAVGLLLTGLVAYLFFWPVPIDPVSWAAPTPPGYTGAYAPNTRLPGCA